MFLQSMRRGLKGRCPHCGEGKLFRSYLKVAPNCAACGHELGKYPADDGPAYFTILIVGHLLVAPLLVFPVIWEASPWIMVPATLVPLTVASLVLLPLNKGWLIGLLYALGVKRSDAAIHTADLADR